MPLSTGTSRHSRRSRAPSLSVQEAKGKLGDAQKLKVEIDQRRTEFDQAKRRGDLARAGELAHGVIPALEMALLRA